MKPSNDFYNCKEKQNLQLDKHTPVWTRMKYYFLSIFCESIHASYQILSVTSTSLCTVTPYSGLIVKTLVERYNHICKHRWTQMHFLQAQHIAFNSMLAMNLLKSKSQRSAERGAINVRDIKSYESMTDSDYIF